MWEDQRRTEKGEYYLRDSTLWNYDGWDTAFCIPNEVKHLSYMAFDNAPDLTAVRIPESVESIQEGAFDGCSALRYLNIPASVTDIEENAFSDLPLTLRVTPGSAAETYAQNHDIPVITSAKPMQSPESDFLIEDGVLEKYLGSAESVWIPETVREIAPQAFQFCDTIRQVVVPGTVKEIGWFAFADSTLQTLVLKEGVEELGYAIGAYSQLRTLVVPYTLKPVWASNLYGYEMEPKYTSPRLLPQLKIYAESGYPADKGLLYYDITKDARTKNGVQFVWLTQQEMDAVVDWAAGGFESPAQLPEGIDRITAETLPVDGLLPGWLGRELYHDIRIPGSVRAIEPDTMSLWHNLRRVVLEEGVPEIGKRAFAMCLALESVEIPGSVKTIETAAFHSCSALAQVRIAEGTEHICCGAFCGYDKERSVYEPLYNYAFLWENADIAKAKETHLYLPASIRQLDTRVWDDNLFSSPFPMYEKTWIHAPAGSFAESHVQFENKYRWPAYNPRLQFIPID